MDFKQHCPLIIFQAALFIIDGLKTYPQESFKLKTFQ